MNARIRTRDVVAGVVADATTDLEKAAGRGGIVSRGEQQQLSPGLQRAVEDVRTAKGPGARVSVGEAATTYEASVSSALAAVNTTGPAWLSLAETRKIADADLQGRVWAVRARQSPLSGAALEARMRAHVTENAEASPFVRTGTAYPSLAGGRAGLLAHRVNGERAGTLAEIAQLWAAKFNAPDPFPGFDTSRSELLVARTTHYDRDSLIVSAVDRASGAVGPPFTLEMGQIFFALAEADFSRLVGTKESFGASEYSFWKIDYRAVIDRLLAGTKSLDVGNPYVDFDPAQAAALSAAAAAVVASAGFTGLTLRLAPPVLAAQEALPGNALTHAAALTIALEALTTSTVGGSSPLSIARQIAMDDAGTTTLTPAIEAAAAARLAQLMARPTTSVRALDLDEEPEAGPGTRDHWVIQLEIPELSDDVHWAVVDRKGVAPVEVISFN
jgi:hypothetical protein